REVAATGNLILTGRPVGAPVNFFARVSGWERAQALEPIEESTSIPNSGNSGFFEIEPLRRGMKLSYSGDHPESVHILITDVAGRIVYSGRLEGGDKRNGISSFYWNGLDGSGHQVRTGIYM